MFTVYKEFWLQAAHQLANLPPSHPCSRIHGHNYKIRVEVNGPTNELGWVIDYADIEAVWMRYIHDKLDHQNLNDVLAVLEGNTTCENLAAWIWHALEPHLTGLSCIEIQEEPTSGCRYLGQ